MNEQIEKIYGETCLAAGNLDEREFCEKFAHLIVRECIECTKEWRDADRSESTRDYSRGYVHGCNDAIVVMKVRFGVEE